MSPGVRERAVSAVVVVLLHAGLLWLLLDARVPTPSPVPAPALLTFEVTRPPSPSPAPRVIRRVRRSGRSGSAGVIARRSAATAPVPIVVPPAATSAPLLPQTGTAIVGGTAAIGTGAGAGQAGGGNGSGGTGDGEGGATRARLVSGTIGARDYPKAERAAHLGGSVTVEFVVETDGRAHGCTVVRSSGHPALDATTCRLVEARFRYRPARDAAGALVSERRGWRQRWWMEGLDR